MTSRITSEAQYKIADAKLDELFGQLGATDSWAKQAALLEEIEALEKRLADYAVASNGQARTEDADGKTQEA